MENDSVDLLRVSLERGDHLLRRYIEQGNSLISASSQDEISLQMELIMISNLIETPSVYYFKNMEHTK